LQVISLILFLSSAFILFSNSSGKLSFTIPIISISLVSILSFACIDPPIYNDSKVELWGQVLKYHFSSSRSILLIALLTVKGQGDVFLYYILRIYIYLIESPPAFKIISPFQFFYILILIRQRFLKILLFLKNKVFTGVKSLFLTIN